jgi:hypothetical protein
MVSRPIIITSVLCHSLFPLARAGSWPDEVELPPTTRPLNSKGGYLSRPAQNTLTGQSDKPAI